MPWTPFRRTVEAWAHAPRLRISRGEHGCQLSNTERGDNHLWAAVDVGRSSAISSVLRQGPLGLLACSDQVGPRETLLGPGEIRDFLRSSASKVFSPRIGSRSCTRFSSSRTWEAYRYRLKGCMAALEHGAP